MATRKRSVARGTAITDTSGGERKGARQAVRHENVRVENIKNARIRVGATHVPKLIGEDPKAQGQLGQLFDQLGDFATGPFAKAMADKQFADIKVDAERDVLAGKTLDDIEDPNQVYEHYYRGAIGRKSAMDWTAGIQQMYDENADNPDFDVNAETNKFLAQRLEGLDAETADNAIQVLQRTITPLATKEMERQKNAARLSIYHAGQEATTVEAATLFANKDYAGGLDVYDAGFQDAKNLIDGPMDAKDYNQFIVSDFVAELQNPNSGMTQLDVDEMEAALKEKRVNGSSLWSNPEVNDRLLKAFAAARKTKSQKQSLEQSVAAREMLRAQADVETMQTEDIIAAHVDNGDITVSQGTGIIMEGRKTVREFDQLMDDVHDYGDGNGVQFADDPPRIEAASKKLVEILIESGESESASNLAVGMRAASDGYELPWLSDRMTNKILSGDPKMMTEAVAYYDAIRTSNTIIGSKVLGSPENRAAAEGFQRLSQEMDPSSAAEVVKAAYPFMQKKRAELTQNGENRDLLAQKMSEANLYGPQLHSAVLGYASMSMALNMPVGDAMDAAIKTIARDYDVDEHDVPMGPANYVAGWEFPNVRQHVRDTKITDWVLKQHPDANDRAYFVGGKLSNDMKVLPLSDGSGILMHNGLFVSAIPLAQWASDSHKEVTAVNVAATRKLNAEADAARNQSISDERRQRLSRSRL